MIDVLIYRPEALKSLEAGYATMPSNEHPGRNEDAGFANPINGTFGVFDGMSGSKNGALAANSASRIIRRKMEEIPSDILLNAAGLEGMLGDALADAGKIIAEGDTTATVVKLWDQAGEKKLSFGHVGDSRIYLLRSTGALVNLTEDHGVLLALKPGRAKLISRKFDETSFERELNGDENIQVEYPDSLTTILGYKDFTSERELFANRHILLRSLRRNCIPVSTGTRTVNRNDLLIMTTDGVHDNLTTSQMRDVLGNWGHAPQVAAEVLIQEAGFVSRSQADGNGRGRSIRAKKDDMSAVVVKIGA